ncbi:uncharacterized protein N0V89_004642 [Didymosphaeria variabile]|uniref:Uncharacterized protein n=1 Tax=Didymosphaeria variabile TaxID=1932322 RepID=A0A9W9CDL5_9PLEO|nr:uncharacterized protein N0V89_004642 [Didymosphaeria variabile]KAJ4356607.1 hypothetical protein N0V89_004642 [Didymosphaeria variabile]
MLWLQAENGEPVLQQLQLDIVGFLAILGEGSVLANAQVSTLSRWIFLPRLIPAPQALMRPTRPTVLEPVDGHITGIYSGNHKDSINHIGNIVCDANNLPAHSVRVVRIERTASNEVKSRTIAPLTSVLFLGFFLSCVLLGLSIWRQDGMSLVATCLLSSLSSLIGYGNKWKLKLPKRGSKKGKVPPGDVVIRYPKGSFLIVRCPEDVARELYFAPETIEYMLQHGPAYRLLSLVGTIMLMGGVICLANAQIEAQIAWAASYMLLGSSYWIVAALPAKLHWDYSCYTVTNESLSNSDMSAKGYPSESDTYTQALWKAIVVSKRIDWVRLSNACPDTRAWNKWLAQAQEQAKTVELTESKTGDKVTTWEVPDWNAQQALVALMNKQAADDTASIKNPEETVVRNSEDV